jgi:hypothetical protein
MLCLLYHTHLIFHSSCTLHMICTFTTSNTMQDVSNQGQEWKRGLMYVTAYKAWEQTPALVEIRAANPIRGLSGSIWKRIPYFSIFDRNISTFHYFCKWPSANVQYSYNGIIERKRSWLSGLLSKYRGKSGLNTENTNPKWVGTPAKGKQKARGLQIHRLTCTLQPIKFLVYLIKREEINNVNGHEAIIAIAKLRPFLKGPR